MLPVWWALASVILAAGCGGGPEVCPCPEGVGANPSGEFANTLIRGRPPGSPFAGNTVATIEEAETQGYGYVEIDVRVTADGHLLPCRHDDLATFSTCRGSVADSTIAELTDCMMTEAAPTPLLPLDDVLSTASFSGIYLDLKSTDTEPLSSPEEVRDAVLALRALLPDPDVLVAMSYARDTADALVAAGIRTGRKGYPDDPAGGTLLVDDAAAAGAEMICVNVDALDDEMAAGAADQLVWLLPWAHDHQVDQSLECALERWQAGGLISTAFDALEALRSVPCAP